jgi:glycosyltransferase involved in cell wall biosynthesis
MLRASNQLTVMFVDLIGWDYLIDTPYQRPLGGSQSAVCYLAEQLARLGHQIFLVNHTRTPRVSRGVHCLSNNEEAWKLMSRCDAIVYLNSAQQKTIHALRQIAGGKPLIIIWTGHASDQPAVADLKEKAVHMSFDALVLVSQWQANQYLNDFQLAPSQIRVLRNAIAPAFIDLFANEVSVLQCKRSPALLAYNSTPFRGLDVLLYAFPIIRRAMPDVVLKVFSDMSLYQVPREKDDFVDLYELCRQTEGVQHIGALAQPQLAQELKQVTCLTYPSTFAETSCIAVMEALAAGCSVITTDLGALPETTSGLATLVPMQEDLYALAEYFGRQTNRVLQEHALSINETETRLRAQVEHISRTCTWAVRAQEWETTLLELRDRFR